MKTPWTLSISLLTALILTPSLASAQEAIDLGGVPGTALTIQSVPTGASFSLEGPAKVHNVVGVTPARVVNIPATEIIIHYADIAGCITPKPQMRYVSALTTANFIGRYDCSPKQQPAVTIQEKPADMTDVSGIKITPHQTEVVPGGSVKYTLAVHNYSKTTQYDLLATAEYDPNQLEITNELPSNGRIEAPGLLSWDVPVLYAGQTWSVIFPLRVRESVSQGKRIDVGGIVMADGEARDVTLASANTSVITPVLPPTGARFDILFLLITGMIALSAALGLRLRKTL